MQVQEAIRAKRAVRQFQEKSLPEEDIQAILNAGRRSQSSKNSQPWNFIAIRDRQVLKDLSECGDWASHLAGAALGVAILIPDEPQRFQLLFDCGQAAAYMQLAAWEMGIGSCIASIYQSERARQILGYPTSHTLRFALSFGYPLEEEALVRPPKKGGRRALDEMTHWDRW